MARFRDARDCIAPDHHLGARRQQVVWDHARSELPCFFFFFFFGTKFCYDGCVRECVVVHGGRPVQFKRNI